MHLSELSQIIIIIIIMMADNDCVDNGMGFSILSKYVWSRISDSFYKH